MNSIFDNLNGKQIEAVKATEGKVRVIAGAGSGKTRVLAHRFAYLVNEIGISPSSILCMTFTNKAAQEMRNRISKMVHQGNVNDFVCTIHGFCVKVLRRDIHRMGYPKNFVIMDDEDAKSFAKQVMQEYELDYSQKTIQKFLNEDVHIYKNTMLEVPLTTYIEKIVLPSAKKEKIGKIEATERYIQLQVNNFALDFTDIIKYAQWILNNCPDVRDYWQEKLNYIMVDEVQDCNGSDWSIINTISARYNNLFIVGDPDQAIYEWRGAKPQMFVRFKADKDIILAENYRSTPNILDVANSIIANNEERVKKDLFTQKPSSKNAVYFHGKTEEDEATWIANKICELNKSGVKFNEIAILYRASYLSRNIEQTLIKKQVKYTIWGGIRFFERKEIKDALAYLRLIANGDDLSFQRIVNVPSRKFGEKSMKLLKEYSEQEGTNLYQTLFNHREEKTFDKEPLHDFIKLINQCRKRQNDNISELFDYLLKASGLWNMYREEGDEERIGNINELINSIRLYENVEREEKATLETYLQDVALFTNTDYKDNGETVKLMTVHQAKGLEFPFVFVCGLNEGIFPNLRTIRESGIRGLEEERRLMYVAVTRAEIGLFLTESEGLFFDKIPSRFLVEIKKELLEVRGGNASLFNETRERVIREPVWKKSDIPEISVGDHVVHETLGEGVVESIESDEGENVFRAHFANSIRYIKNIGSIQMINRQKSLNEYSLIYCKNPDREFNEYFYLYELIETNLEDMGLSTRTMNIFKNNNIVTIEDLVRHTREELQKTQGFGKNCLQEVEELLESLNLEFGYEVDSIIDKYNLYKGYVRERCKTLVPFLRTPLCETRILNTSYYDKIIGKGIETIGDLMRNYNYHISRLLSSTEAEDVLSFFEENNITFFDPEPYYKEYDIMQSAVCEKPRSEELKETTKKGVKQVSLTKPVEFRKENQKDKINLEKEKKVDISMEIKYSGAELLEIMKKARLGNADAIMYCAQHKIDPFNFDDNFFFDYDNVRIGDWFYDDGSFSRNRSDLKKCVGVVFSLVTSQLEQADGWTHGLIVAIKDATQGGWGENEDLAYPHTHYTIKDLEVLEKTPESFNDYHTEYLLRDSNINAFRKARKFKLGLPTGKTSGWFLPSIAQLRQIACNLSPETLNKISMNGGDIYLSSSQSNANEVCYIYISKSIDGNNTNFSFGTTDKDCPLYWIRSIAAF